MEEADAEEEEGETDSEAELKQEELQAIATSGLRRLALSEKLESGKERHRTRERTAFVEKSDSWPVKKRQTQGSRSRQEGSKGIS